jgi:hypothetical protein
MSDTPTELATDLTVSDMKSIATLIEVCTQRGAFKAQELALVGQIYNKIAAVLSSVSDSK